MVGLVEERGGREGEEGWGRKPLWPYLLGSGVAPTTAKYGDLKKDFIVVWDIVGLVWFGLLVVNGMVGVSEVMLKFNQCRGE